jgi:formylmethanofuran dehydrogenase subunit E
MRKNREREKKMKGKAISSAGDFSKCIEFHGHTCPGLAIGFRAARTLMERLGVKKAPDEELVAIVETDACGADAIQVMTGCTFGKGNFLFKNYGKHAFSLMDRSKGKGVRVCLRSDAFKIDPESLSLFEKVQKDEVSAKEIERYRQLQQGRVQKILDMDAESLFKIEEISPDIPPKARVIASEICDFCGEPTKMDLLRKIDGKKVCILCAHQCGFCDRSSSTSHHQLPDPS